VRRSFVIDALPESAAEYRDDHALVAVDVFRATTVILTALARGHAVHPVATIEDALLKARWLPGPLLAGEQQGIVPAGFEMDNSPASLEGVAGRRSIVLLTSAGTLLLQNCRGADGVYVACLRNLRATAAHLAGQERRVALIGAGTRGKSRPEDQLVCAWIGERLQDHGFEPETESTVRELRRYAGADLTAVVDGSASSDWLRSANKFRDVEFVLTHVDDLPRVAIFDGEQVTLLPDATRGPSQPPRVTARTGR
jgi:2-phosphosulfolactate phosphatase